MQDRTSVYPGRIKLTPVPGQDGYYDMERADQPTQPGTALNKNNLLKDATAALYGLDANAVPDEVFSAIRTLISANAEGIANGVKIATGSYAGTGESAKSLTFNFVPKLVIVSGYVSAGNASGYTYQLAIHGGEFYGIRGRYNYTEQIYSSVTTWSGNTVAWENNAQVDGGNFSFNVSGKTYHYIAIA